MKKNFIFVNCLTSLEHLCSLRSQPLVLKITINKCKIMINLTSFSQNSRVMRTSGLQWNREKKNTHTHTKTNKKRILRQTWENMLRTVFGKWAMSQ